MNIKKLFALLLVALLALSMVACGNKEDDVDTEDDEQTAESNQYENFTYGVSGEGTYEITGYTYGGTEFQDITIPSEIGGREVTGIAKDAFKAVKTIRSVTIPEGITYIGQYAFYDCDNITSIVLPSTVTEIGVGAFENCDKLASVTLSASLKKIDKYTFKDCAVLTGVTIPESVKVIADGAFYGCAAITTITLPGELTDLGACAFYGCTALKTATVLSEKLGVNEEIAVDEEEVEIVEHTIGEKAFAGCDPDSKGQTQTVFTVTAGSKFAAYAAAEGYDTVAPQAN